MSEEEVLRRLEKLETSYTNLSDSLNRLDTTIALLGQAVDGLRDAETKRDARVNAIVNKALGAVVLAVVGFLLGGGLIR